MEFKLSNKPELKLKSLNVKDVVLNII
jgi:hypothetical protein